jgi:hypothetical protein
MEAIVIAIAMSVISIGLMIYVSIKDKKDKNRTTVK